MLNQSNRALEDLQENVAPATNGDGAWIGVIVVIAVIVGTERDAN